MRRNPLSHSFIMIVLSIATFVSPAYGGLAMQQDSLAIIPNPLHVDRSDGKFTLNAQTRIVYFLANRDMHGTAEYLAKQLRGATGFPMKIQDATDMPDNNYIFLNSIREEELGNEGYVLRVEKEGVFLEANHTNGFFYAAQTLLQLLPPQAFSPKHVSKRQWDVPHVTVTDTPRYAWRGMMLDVSRHFFPKEFVKRFIDFLATHKMNTFHWHLTDDQGWRIEIKRYPELTQKSAWRADREGLDWNARPPQMPGETPTYGGFYTQKEIREIVQYAQERFITIVPEIEMPAHATAVLAAFPQYSCTGGPFTAPTGGLWPIKDIYCAGNDSTFTFLENILSEVIPLFPGAYVHIGGDEANKTEWKRCPKCQAAIKREGLKNEAELQSYFTTRIEKYLKSKGKRLIGWDEILEGGIAPEATVMSWRGTAGGITAARANHDVVMTPNTSCYFDYYQADPSLEPVAIGGFLPLEKVYTYDPTPDSLSAHESIHILGVQANLWTEYIPAPSQAEYMIFPRIAAVAELGWSARDRKDWANFKRRLSTQMERYRAAGINASRSFYAVALSDTFDTGSWTRIVTLEAGVGFENIRYTLDGTPPAPTSTAYGAPIMLSRTMTIKAATFEKGSQLGPVTERTMYVSRKGIKGITLATPFESRFRDTTGTGLIDNLRGTVTMDRNRWYGLQGKDFEAVIDLGTSVLINHITTGFIHRQAPTIFLPSMVEYSVSDDGTNFKTVASVRPESRQQEERTFIQDIGAALTGINARYIKIRAINPGLCPAWHKLAGQPTWISMDEIVVD